MGKTFGLTIACLVALSLTAACSKKSADGPSPSPPETVTAADLAGAPGLFSGTSAGNCQLFNKGTKVADCTTVVRIQQNGKYLDGSITVQSGASIQTIQIPTLEIFGNGIVYRGDLIGKIGARALTYSINQGETMNIKLVDINTVAYSFEKTSSGQKITGLSSRQAESIGSTTPANPPANPPPTP